MTLDQVEVLPVITWAPPDRPCEICAAPTPLLVDGRRIHALGCKPKAPKEGD